MYVCMNISLSASMYDCFYICKRASLHVHQYSVEPVKLNTCVH